MLTKRIIPCLDVKNNQVVKGIRFRDHQVVGDILTLAKRYASEGADELVFYDITASPSQKVANVEWVSKVAEVINIPFCVAGGIHSIAIAQKILRAGADKISINSPALENPDLISELSNTFGNQCIVVGIDSFQENGEYFVYQYTGDTSKTIKTKRKTLDWAYEAQTLGAGEIVLNCMNQDGVRQGYDIDQLKLMKEKLNIPLIASGGAGTAKHFQDVFEIANVDGALAASVFHSQSISIPTLKQYLNQQNIGVRI